MKRLMISAAVLGLLAGPALAQPKEQRLGGANPAADEAKASEAAAVDRQYRSTIERLRKDGATVKTDPWSNMRGTDDAKTKR
jgi:hypothetical protein